MPTINTRTTTVPVTIPANASVATAVVSPSAADWLNASARIDVALEISRDGGVTYKPFVTAGWKGGTSITDLGGNVNPPISISYRTRGLLKRAGQLLRVAVIPNGSVTVTMSGSVI